MKLSKAVVLKGTLYRIGDNIPDSISLPEGLKKYITDGEEENSDQDTTKGSTKTKGKKSPKKTS
jgi:hypothetical protein